ncbi:baseplate J/gp47 family protein [Erythrobacter sp. THAF29]|uniref:baseplate J/gp47 family protein n=1 Tax=Erythrobacter sp. THAF29 TaxID=2587851 RepID=UPI0012A9B3AB|nr:baseplate J/gp47 family protein [Erythrobacter sp. THAF29]QFT76045.1 Baseplate J-like protein [Erythrobacter sp. THAF29]
MSLPLPNLDDRSWQELVDIALTAVHADKTWTDRNPADPGVTLLELFAYLTKNLHYRMNRIPERLQIALLNLVGIERRPAAAAVVELEFVWEGEGKSPDLPPGVVVTSEDGAFRFTLAEKVTFATGDTSARGKALHASWHAETIGEIEDASLQSFRLKHPVVLETGFGDDIVVGIALREGDEQPPASELREDEGAHYRLHPAANPDRPGGRADSFVAWVDRGEGLLRLVAGSEAPLPLWRSVRVWYLHGGGAAGNLPAGTLSLIDGDSAPIAIPEGLSVMQPEPAGGGADAETLKEAARRTPFSAAAISAAVTPRDYERLARSAGGVLDAVADAPAQSWAHAERGTVRVEIAPVVDGVAPSERIGADAVNSRRTQALLDRVAARIAPRRPLGVELELGWLQVREIEAHLRIVAATGSDISVLQSAISARLNALFAPANRLAKARELRAFDVYEAVLSEPGVRYADGLAFHIGEAPGDSASDVIVDPHQGATWYVCAAGGLYRTLDDGSSWCRVFEAEEGEAAFVRIAEHRPGLLIYAQREDGDVRLFATRDAGNTWQEIARFDFGAYDAAWMERRGEDVLLVATSKGLYEIEPGGTPKPVPTGTPIDEDGCYALALQGGRREIPELYIAARNRGGVFHARIAGATGGFSAIGLEDVDIRRLFIHRRGGRAFLWAAAGAEAGEPGKGAFQLELRAGANPDPSAWTSHANGWRGGSCEGMAFSERYVFAGSNRSGVLTLDLMEEPARWKEGNLASGLPHRDRERLFEPVRALAARPAGHDGGLVLLAAGPAGVHRSLGEDRYENASQTVFADRAPLPAGWLYCSGEHRVDIVVEGEGGAP